nr:MAG TPA: hypothetical protein [Caudoviricetes sp.]
MFRNAKRSVFVIDVLLNHTQIALERISFPILTLLY